MQSGLETRARAVRRLERCTEGLDGSTPGQRLVLASVASVRSRASETAREAAAHLEEVVIDERFVSDQQAGVIGLGLSFDLSLGLIAADALDSVDAYLERMLMGARAQAAILSVAFLTGRRGLLALRRGAVAAAEADGRTSLELLAAHGISLGLPFTLALLVEALVEVGELDAAERELRDGGFDGAIPSGPTSIYLLEARGLLRLAQGKARDGLDDLVEFGRREELWALVNPLGSRWRSHDGARAGRDRRSRRGAAYGSRRSRSRASMGHGQERRRRLARGGPDRRRRGSGGRSTRGRRGAGTLTGTARVRPRRLPTLARRCAAPTVERTLVPRWSRRWTSPRGSVLAHLPTVLAPSCARPGAGRVDRRAAG